MVGSGYSLTLSVAGGVPPYRWSLQSGPMPDYVKLSETGLVAGTPTKPGVFRFVVSVTDSSSSSVAVLFTLGIATAPLQNNTSRLPAGTVGISYGEVINVIGGTGGDSWGVDQGTLPTGLLL